MRNSLTLLFWLAFACWLWADDLAVLPDRLEDGPTSQRLTRQLRRQAEVAFAKRQIAYEAIKSADDARAYQQRIRELFVAQLGPLPERTPLEARVVGTLKGEGYRVEKLIFASQPQHHVTAVVFLPIQSEPPFPAVLIPCGHSSDGKASQQRMCILLAKNGIAAMSYDPIGQGERHQLLDEQGKPRLKMTDEHTLLGSTSILVGRNTATYRVWDGIRAIDYLASRDDIDKERIGVTGCSGGGTLTSYLMALDDRVACAAPSCYITSFPRLLATIGPQDAEQNIHAQIALGIDHADYLHMRAPRPTLILASTRDFFDIEGTWHTFREAKRFYTRLGHPERVSLVETDAQHGFPRAQREAMASWMSRWLLGRDQMIAETDFAAHSAAEMRCTPRGEVLFLDDERSVVDLNVELATKLRPQRVALWREGNHAGALAEVRELTGIRPLDKIPPAKVRESGVLKREGYLIEKLVLEPEGGVELPALLFRPVQASGRKMLYLHGLGKHADAEPGGRIEKLVLAGNLVLAVDLSGCGETGTSQPTMLGADWNDVFISYLLGRPLVGLRAEDVIVATRYLSQLPWRENDAVSIHVISVGAAGPPALHAVALERALFDELELHDFPPQWSEYLHDPARPGQMANVVHGALAAYDFSDLIGSLGTNKVKIVKQRDAEQQLVITERTAKLPPFFTQVIGSLPRPQAVRELLAQRDEMPAGQFERTLDDYVVFAIRVQEQVGLDVISDGEWRRSHYIGEFLSRVGGFERCRRYQHQGETKLADVVVRRMDVGEPVFAEDARFLAANTDRCTKFALPSPFLIAVRYWHDEYSCEAYPTMQDFMDHLAEILAREAQALVAAGIDIVQIDDPALTYFCDRRLTSGEEIHDERLRRTWNADKQFPQALAAIDRIVRGLSAEVHLHCCHSVYKRQSDVIGDYKPILPRLANAHVDRINLEFAYPQTGDVSDLTLLPGHLAVGLGVVDVRSEQFQTVEAIESLGLSAAKIVMPARIALNPDCGFAPGAGEPPSLDEAYEKLKRLVEAARRLRNSYEAADHP